MLFNLVIFLIYLNCNPDCSTICDVLMAVNDHIQFTNAFRSHARYSWFNDSTNFKYFNLISRKVMKPDRNFQMQNQFRQPNFLGIRLNMEIGRLKSRCRNIRYVVFFKDIFSGKK